MKDFYRTLPGEARQYLRQRSEMAHRYSDFDACERHECSRCCTDKIGIELTGFDFLAMAMVSGLSPEEIFDEYTIINLDFFKEPGKVFPQVSINMPCGFLLDGKCSIYRDSKTGRYVGKPIPCSIFPEDIIYLNQMGISEEAKGENPEVFSVERHGYPCMEESPHISDARAEVVVELETTMIRERNVTRSYLGIHPYPMESFIGIEKPPSTKEEIRAMFEGIKEKFAAEFGKGTEFYDMVRRRIAALGERKAIIALFDRLRQEGEKKRRVKHLLRYDG